MVFASSLLALPAAGIAADNCSWIVSPTSNHYFNGRLGTEDTVRLVLSFHNCTATGTWFDSVTFEDFEAQGSLDSDHAVSLTLKDSSGHVVATVNGKFEPDHLDLTGTVSGTNPYHGREVHLKLDRWWNGTDADVVENTGITDLSAFNEATLRFWRGVRDNDAETVSQCIRYPLPATIYEAGQSPRTINVSDAEMLKERYIEIFNADRREAILSHLPRHLIWGTHVNTIRLGDSIGKMVLFDPKGQVVELP